MARRLSIYNIISLQLLGFLFHDNISPATTENTPRKNATVVEYLLEAVDGMGRERWRYILPDDTDLDQDGRVSDLEIQYKVHSYLGELFNMIDQDKDNIITREEMSSLKFAINNTERFIKTALQNYPLKTILLAADSNRDGLYNENDFYMPANLIKRFPNTYTRVELRDSIVYAPDSADAHILYKVAQIGDKEANVICKSLGFEGLDKIMGDMGNMEEDYDPYYGPYDGPTAELKFTCQGNESRLEYCQSTWLNDPMPRNDVLCRGEQQLLGPLHLVGGNDPSSGDVFFGKKGFNCYDDTTNSTAVSEVICRELGFSGFLKTTRGTTFTRHIYPTYYSGYEEQPEQQVLNKIISCNGTEQKIADCQISDKDPNNYHCGGISGIVCETDGRREVDEDLANLINNVTFWNPDCGRKNDCERGVRERFILGNLWEKFGRFLFVKEGQQLDLEVISQMAVDYVSQILKVFDQNQDGDISIQDFTSIEMKLEPMQALLNLFFRDATSRSNGEIDLWKPTFSGKRLLMYQHFSNLEDMPQFVKIHEEYLDTNYDEKLTAVDFLKRRLREGSNYLIPFLLQKLDKNQDGKLRHDELKQFVDDMFHQFDMDGNGAITLDDVKSFMRKHGFDCFQAGAFKSYVSAILNMAETQFTTFMSDRFKQIDHNANGRVTLQEFQEMHIPCHFRHGMESWYVLCSRTMNEKILWPLEEVKFPDLDKISGQHNSVMSKMTNAACDVLT